MSDFERKVRNLISNILENYDNFMNKIKNNFDNIDYTEYEFFEKFPLNILKKLENSYSFIGDSSFYFS